MKLVTYVAFGMRNGIPFCAIVNAKTELDAIAKVEIALKVKNFNIKVLNTTTEGIVFQQT